MSRIDFELLTTRVREEKLTFKKLEGMTSLSRGTIHNVMNGKSDPSYTVARLIIDALSLTPEDILAIFFPNIELQKEIRL